MFFSLCAMALSMALALALALMPNSLERETFDLEARFLALRAFALLFELTGDGSRDILFMNLNGDFDLVLSGLFILLNSDDSGLLLDEIELITAESRWSLFSFDLYETSTGSKLNI